MLKAKSVRPRKKLESGEDCWDVKDNEDQEIECKSVLKEASVIKSRNYGRSRIPSPSQHIHGNEKYEEIPKEFFYPNSNKFMADPITIPASDFIYDQDFVKELHHPKDVQPDLIMRKVMEGIHCEAQAIIVEDTLSLVPKDRSATEEIIKTCDDLEFLKQQTRHVEDADAATIYPSGNHQNGKVGIIRMERDSQHFVNMGARPQNLIRNVEYTVVQPAIDYLIASLQNSSICLRIGCWLV
jgi:hypothetical protein